MGDADDVGNKKLYFDFCHVLYEWKQRFSKSFPVSCKPILDGIQAIEDCGIVLEPLPQLPVTSPREDSREQSSIELNGKSESSSQTQFPINHASEETFPFLLPNRPNGLDLKVLYRHVSQLLAGFDEKGDAAFLDPSFRNLLLYCSNCQQELLQRIEREVHLGTNEKVIVFLPS